MLAAQVYEGLLEYQSQFADAEPGTAESLQYERIDRKIQNLIKPEWSEADRGRSQESTLRDRYGDDFPMFWTRRPNAPWEKGQYRVKDVQAVIDSARAAGGARKAWGESLFFAVSEEGEEGVELAARYKWYNSASVEKVFAALVKSLMPPGIVYRVTGVSHFQIKETLDRIIVIPVYNAWWPDFGIKINRSASECLNFYDRTSRGC